MILIPTAFKAFYVLLKVMETLKESGYDIKLLKEELFVPFVCNSSDEKFNENQEIVTLQMLSRGSYTTDVFVQKIKDILSLKYKKFGFAKVSSTSRFDFVIGETRKNSVFMAQSFSEISNILININRQLSQEKKDLNKEAMDFVGELVTNNPLAGYYYQTGSFSRVSYASRNVRIGTGDRVGIINYHIGKMKYREISYYSTNDNQSLLAYIRTVDAYIKLKEDSKKIIFHGENADVCIYDLLFLDATATSDEVNANPRYTNTLRELVL